MNPTILEACINGDRLAQQQLYNCYKGKLFAVCMRYAHSREDAEDIFQDGFVLIFKDLRQYTGVGNLEGWLRKVMVNTALQHLRKQKKLIQTIEFDGQEHAEDTDDLVMDEQLAKNLVRILQKLPSGFRTVFNLYVLEGYTHPEIAEILDISVGTSKSQLMRAKAHFRKLLENSLVQ
jgi:RNA polymerase sigma factor (sigma-70 family)